MNDEIDKTLKVLLKSARENDLTSGDAMRLAQAVLNLAHARITLYPNKSPK